MIKHRIATFEHKCLYYDNAGQNGFRKTHFELLQKYHDSFLPKRCPYFTLGRNYVKFNQFVGVLKVGELTIEVLPKIDNYDVGTEEKAEKLWQKMLVKMLFRALQVEAKVTTTAALSMHNHSVLETYLYWFLEEVDKLVRQGLTKKYRVVEHNTTALKGKLLVHKQITCNAVHKERFYVAQSIYNFDNAYNAILRQALEVIGLLYKGASLGQKAEALLFDFPECTKVKISEGIFAKLKYDRKTAPYRQAIELARVILLNFHPDVRGGQNNVLAIMFDMNNLWEKYIFWCLRKSLPQVQKFAGYTVREQRKKEFWTTKGQTVSLKPDILILPPVVDSVNHGKTLVIDTKWKYDSGITAEDLRQIYAYGDYFSSNQGFLLYPAKREKDKNVTLQNGSYSDIVGKSSKDCSLLLVDLLDNLGLNEEIGKAILEEIAKEIFVNKKGQQVVKPADLNELSF